MRKVIYGIEVILIIGMLGALAFFNMNAARISSISSLENEPIYEEIKNSYVELLNSNLVNELTQEEKYLLTQAGITLIDEKTQKFEMKKDGRVLNIYNPKLFKKSKLIFEIYYLTENSILVRNSDGKKLENLKGQILENPD